MAENIWNMTQADVNIAKSFQAKLRLHVGQNLVELIRMEAQIEGLQAEVTRLHVVNAGLEKELEQARADKPSAP